MIYDSLFILPFMISLYIWFKLHYWLQRFWSSCKTSCQCSRRTREFTNIHGSWTGANTKKKKTGLKFEWSTIMNHDQFLNIQIVQIIAFSLKTFQFIKRTIMENCRFADSNDHGCPFDNNNKAWWVCLDQNEVELFTWTIYDLLELFPGVWTKWTASWMLTWTRPQHWLSLDISTASLGIDCFFCWENWKYDSWR